jgi:hypothetical protein
MRRGGAAPLERVAIGSDFDVGDLIICAPAAGPWYLWHDLMGRYDNY